MQNNRPATEKVLIALLILLPLFSGSIANELALSYDASGSLHSPAFRALTTVVCALLAFVALICSIIAYSVASRCTETNRSFSWFTLLLLSVFPVLQYFYLTRIPSYEFDAATATSILTVLAQMGVVVGVAKAAKINILGFLLPCVVYLSAGVACAMYHLLTLNE